MVQTLRVPITYGPKDKVLSRVEQDPALSRPFSSILPYISFEMISMAYDGDRTMNSSGKIAGLDTRNKNLAQFVYNPVAWNFKFELNIMVKNLEDGSKILEQILPFFTPNWTATVRLIDDPIIEKDIPVTLDLVTSEDNWSGNFDERRNMTHKLDFTMEGFLFGPVQKDRIIKFVKGNVMTDLGELDASVVITPGMTVDGLPTNDPALTVDWSEIDWTDDYGLIETREIDTN